MAEQPVARRYAQALFELGVEHDRIEDFGEALGNLRQLFDDSDEFRAVVLNPALKLDERRDVLRAVAEKVGWPDLFRNFTLLLLDKDRLRFIGDIHSAYRKRLDDHLGRARARVSSAVALDDAQIDKLKARLDELTGKDVAITAEVDEDLIGGVVARVGSTIYDGSVRTHLQRMREAILRQV